MLFDIFLIYAFIGWIVEIIYSYIFESHKLVNRGFLIGPIIPIYGIGALILTSLLFRYKDDPLVIFSLSVIVCSILEYSTSYLMEKIFKNRWWDYSYMKFNINGRICLETMIPFGIGAIFIIKYIHPNVLKILKLIPNNIRIIITILLFILTLIDFITSFGIIIKLKNISSSIKTDSTEAITKQVKEILMKKNVLYKRLVESFPNMKVFNKLSILKDKIKHDKIIIKRTEKELKEEKRLLRHKKRER